MWQRPPPCRPIGLRAAGRAQQTGVWPQGPPPHHPPVSAQLGPLARSPDWHSDFLPPSPPPQALTLFFFSKSFSMWSWARKLGRGGLRVSVYVFMCVYICVCAFACLGDEYVSLRVCVYPCGHMCVFRCVCDSLSTRRHLSGHIYSCVCLWGHLHVCVCLPMSLSIFTCMGFLVCLGVPVNARGIWASHLTAQVAGQSHSGYSAFQGSLGELGIQGTGT